MQLIYNRCLKNLKEIIKSELILNRLKHSMAKKQKPENSLILENFSGKKQKTNTLNNFITETDSFISRSIHISKIFYGTHHQEGICFGTNASKQYLYI